MLPHEVRELDVGRAVLDPGVVLLPDPVVGGVLLCEAVDLLARVRLRKHRVDLDADGVEEDVAGQGEVQGGVRGQPALQDGVELVHPEKKVVENSVFQNYFFYARAGTKLFVFSPCLQMELAWSMVHIQST